MTQPQPAQSLDEAIADHYTAQQQRDERRRLEQAASGYQPDPAMDELLATRDRVGRDAWEAADRGFSTAAPLAIYETRRDAHRQLEELRAKEGNR